MAGVTTPLSATELQSQELRMETPELDEVDKAMVGVLRDTQAAWAIEHPLPKLLVGKVFPTTCRDAVKIPYSLLDKTESLTSPEYQLALRAVLGGRFPEVIQLAISHLFLNYFSANEQLIQSKGRHLCMLKAYDLKRQCQCWFIPLSEIEALQAASSQNVKQGLSYNDLALVQTYCIAGVLALHAETWGERPFANRPARGGYGECTWIGGTAFHYGWIDREEASDFAAMGMDKMPELAEKRAKEREKRARKKANQKKRKADEKEQQLKKHEEEKQEADAERRKNLIPIDDSFAEALKSMALEGADRKSVV